MEKDLKKEVNKMIDKLYYHNSKIKSISENLGKKLQKYLTFEIKITYCQGDGFLILNDNSCSVYSLECLDEIKDNILTEDDVMDYSL